MQKTMGRNIAVIPARGGSKRIPKKNIKPFLGKPIIQYSIAAALESGCFDEVMVSTDSGEIADVAVSLGARAPFLRSERTSDDHAGLTDVIEEVLTSYQHAGIDFATCCCILPTAPLLTGPRIGEAGELLRNDKKDVVLPIVRFSYPIQRALVIDNGRVRMMHPENREKRSQDFIETYHDAGQFYWMDVGSFLKTKALFTDNTGYIVISETECQDIDNIEDWEIAELKFRAIFKEHD